MTIRKSQRLIMTEIFSFKYHHNLFTRQAKHEIHVETCLRLTNALSEDLIKYITSNVSMLQAPAINLSYVWSVNDDKCYKPIYHKSIPPATIC